MAIDAKIDFLRQAEKAMADRVTAAQMDGIMEALNDVLQGYDMQAVRFMDEGKDDLLQCYLDALRVQGRSEKTIRRYQYIISAMMKEVCIPTRQITVYHLRSYLAKIQGRGLKDTTAENTRQVFSAYFNWLQRESLIEKNPTANLGSIKCAKLKKKTFTEVDIDSLKQNCKTERDRALICFLSATGCRVSEATGLNRDDIDFSELKCVVHGKGNKERTVYLDPVAAAALKKYLNGRKDNSEALFAGRGGKRLMPNGVRVMMKGLAERAGVDHVHPHKFRRTLATDLARHGMPIQQISAVLGHDKLDTTMRYVIQNDDDIRYSYRKYA